MSGFNKVILLGNLTRDPELKYLPNNTAVCEFGLAINREWKNADGQKQEEVCFVDVAAFGRPAEVIKQYMAKGRKLLVEGRLKYESWTAQDGTKRNKLRVVAEGFQFIGDKPGGQGGAHESPPTDDKDARKGRVVDAVTDYVGGQDDSSIPF